MSQIYSNQSQRMSLSRLLAFAAPAAVTGAIFLPLTIFLPPLYSELGLDLAVVGMVFLIARVWDGFTDPVLGVLADRFGGRFGRRKPWVILSVPVLCISIYQVFSPPSDPTSGYLLAWLLVLYIGWTMLTISHVAWASELSEEYDERSRIMAALQALTIVGGMALLVFAAALEMNFLPDSSSARVALIGWSLVVSLPILVTIALRATDDEPRPPSVSLPWRTMLVTFLANRSLIRLISADLLIGIQIGVSTSLHVFFVSHVLGMPKSASLLFVTTLMAGLLCVPFWLRVSYKIGKHRTLCLSAFVGCVAAFLIAALPVASLLLSIMAFVVMGAYFGSRELLMRSMMADVVLEDSVMEGGESARSGTFYALLTLTAKLGAALAVGSTFWVLSVIGFSAEGVNTSETLTYFRWLMGVLPALSGFGVILILWKFPIDAKRQLELRKELENLNQAPAVDGVRIREVV